MALYHLLEDAAARSKLNLPNKSYRQLLTRQAIVYPFGILNEIYDWLDSHNISRDAAINLMREVEIAMQINREDEDKVNELWEIYQALTMYVDPYREWDD